MKATEHFRTWLGDGLISIGLKLVGARVEETKMATTHASEDEDDEDAAPAHSVTITENARRMIAEGMPVPPSIQVRKEEPLRGSAADRIAKSRAKYEMG